MVRAPSEFVMIVGLPPSIAATAELVVPKSMPTTCSGAGNYLKASAWGCKWGRAVAESDGSTLFGKAMSVWTAVNTGEGLETSYSNQLSREEE